MAQKNVDAVDIVSVLTMEEEMRNYRNSIMKRLLGIVLSLMLVTGLMPAGAFAAGAGGSFILVAEAGGKLVIAPEYVEYKDGQSVAGALEQSGHQFAGLENDWITAIDGVVGNYSRSDENGSYDLRNAASASKFFRFCEDENSTPSAGLQQLMTAMADYQKKAADVQAAAKAAYDTAFNQFVGLDSDSASVLADALNKAMNDYESAQSGTKYKVTFENGTAAYSGAEITVSNGYGKVWNDDGDGVLYLPKGEYSFSISKDGNHVEGEIPVSGALIVTATLPQKAWLKQSTFRLSGSYEDLEGESKFANDEYTLETWNGRNASVAVNDTFTGRIYSYAEYDSNQLKELPTLTAIYTSASTGEVVSTELPFESLTSGISGVLQKGAAGNTVIYRISSKGSHGYTYSQDYTVKFNRVPTLQGITVTDQNGVDQAATEAFDANKKDYTYKVIDEVTAVKVSAVPLESGYSVTINGQNGSGQVTVPVSGETVIPVVVTAGDYSSTYNLTISPGAGKSISFVTSNGDVTMEVVNKNGQVLPYSKIKESSGGNRYQYTLVPGETYSYVATCGTYYHVADEFKMEDVADSTISVDVPMEDWMTELAFGDNRAASKKGDLPLDKSFATSSHSYKVKFTDTEHNAYVWASAAEGTEITAIYEQKFNAALYHGKEYNIDITSGNTTGTQLKRFLMDENPIENTVTIRLTKEINGVTCYQDYVVDFQRELSLKNISAKCGGATMTLVQPNGKQGFKTDVKEYSVTVSMAAPELNLDLTRYTDNRCYGEEEVGYRVKVNGVDVTETDSAVIPLDGTLETQNVAVTVENDKAPAGTTTYIIHVLKSPPVDVDFNLNPGNALLAMYETMSGERVWPQADGSFQLCEGYSYNYNLTAYGYQSRTGTLTVTRSNEKALIVKDGDAVYSVTEGADGGGALSLNWALTAAEKNTSIKADMESEWANFRGNEDNNGVTDAAIPHKAENGTLYWANKLGEGYSADAVGSPILVDGDLITYAGNKIFRVDTVTGQVKATGTMDHKSAHATTPPSYAEGMVFVALTDGTVQAFNAETLESLWIYKDPLGGQPVCPLTVKDGYLYTGFWNNEVSNANFVCISITDENPNKTDEAKSVSWYHTAAGGYYWAGAYVSEDFVLIGTDDGTHTCTGQSSSLLMFDPATGRLLDSWSGLNGDIRSSIVYDKATDAYYFTSKGGGFYSVKVSGGKLTDKWGVKLSNGTEATPMSTCSPSIYNGRAYVGVSGAGQFAAYSGHNITVIDLQKKAIAYNVETQGYPQTSGLLTTAYEKSSGYVYVYFFDNMTPGKLRVLRDKPGQTKADYTTVENGYSTAYALFTPTGNQAQYAICSPIVDEYGTVYFKNDSAHMMAFGSTIQKIEVTKNPDKMTYLDGQAFDPTGMVVTATYSNGKTRDITSYVTYDIQNITEGNTTVTISFPYAMYQNKEDGTGMLSGISTTTPVTQLTVNIGEEEPPVVIVTGDVDQNGVVDTNDAGLVVSYYYGDLELTSEQKSLADVNGDGLIDTDDAGLIVSYYHGSVTQFR